MRNDKLANYLHLHFIVFIWGFTAVLGALITLEAIPLVWYRMFLATFFIFLFIKFKKQTLKFPKKTILAFCFAGFLIAMHWIFFFSAIKVSNVSITLSIMSTGAFFGSFLEPIFFKRKVIWYEVFFGLLAIVGLYIIFKADTNNLEGMLLALASAFLGALFSVINGKFAISYKASVITFYELGFGMLCITAYLAFNGRFTAEFFTLRWNDLIFILILASVCTAYAFLASVHVMKWISPYTVMLTTNMEPVYGIILALFILGDAEYMSPQFYNGAVIIIITVIANGIIKNRLERKQRTLPNT